MPRYMTNDEASSETTPNTTRRAFLGGLAAISVGLAGCAGEPDDNSDGESEGVAGTDTGGEGDYESEPESGYESSPDDEGSGSEAPVVEVVVTYDGEWGGALGADGSSSSVSGSGDDTLTIDTDAETQAVSALIQKDEDNSDELSVQLVVDGEVEEEGSTSEAYGAVSLSTALGY